MALDSAAEAGDNGDVELFLELLEAAQVRVAMRRAVAVTLNTIIE